MSSKIEKDFLKLMSNSVYGKRIKAKDFFKLMNNIV